MKILMVVKSFKSTVKEAEKKQEIFPRAGTSDLTERALEGRKSLHRRKKSGELVILERKVVMDTNLYKKIFSQHIGGNIFVSREPVDVAENIYCSCKTNGDYI